MWFKVLKLNFNRAETAKHEEKRETKLQPQRRFNLIFKPRLHKAFLYFSRISWALLLRGQGAVSECHFLKMCRLVTRDRRPGFASTKD